MGGEFLYGRQEGGQGTQGGRQSWKTRWQQGEKRLMTCMAMTFKERTTLCVSRLAFHTARLVPSENLFFLSFTSRSVGHVPARKPTHRGREVKIVGFFVAVTGHILWMTNLRQFENWAGNPWRSLVSLRFHSQIRCHYIHHLGRRGKCVNMDL